MFSQQIYYTLLNNSQRLQFFSQFPSNIITANLNFKVRIKSKKINILANSDITANAVLQNFDYCFSQQNNYDDQNINNKKGKINVKTLKQLTWLQSLCFVTESKQAFSQNRSANIIFVQLNQLDIFLGVNQIIQIISGFKVSAIVLEKKISWEYKKFRNGLINLNTKKKLMKVTQQVRTARSKIITMKHNQNQGVDITMHIRV